MKTEIADISLKTLFLSLFALLFAVPAFAYPPDNAALLYYQVCSFYNPSREIKDMLSAVARCEIDPNETIVNHVEQNRHIIEIITDAGEIQNCDWALDYSKGMNSLMPPLGCLKASVYLTLADGRIKMLQGDFKTGFERFLSAQKMARHVTEQTYVSYLVATAIYTRADMCLQDALSNFNFDLETLLWLRTELVTFDPDASCLIAAHNGEKQWYAVEMRRERVHNIVSATTPDDDISSETLAANEQILTADDYFFEKNREYWFHAMDTLENVLQSRIPYPQSYGQLASLTKQFETAYEQNPDALLTARLLPALPKIYSLGTRAATTSNATQAALDLYIIKAQTGQLPDTLPAGLPPDLFSGEDFQYERTADGFILRCRGKDLDKNEAYTYEFKV